MTNLELDWSSAEVSERKLTVSLTDRPSDEWAASFERTAHLLDRGTWPGIKLKKGQITVKEIEPGTEERLRFFLESVVQEANAEQGLDEEEEAGEEEETEEPGEDEESESRSEADQDEQMTEQFRSFGGGAGESSEHS